MAQARYRKLLERIQGWTAGAKPYWFGDRITPHDAYAFTLLRWGGIAGIDPKSLPGYLAYVERVDGRAAGGRGARARTGKAGYLQGGLS